MKAEHVEICRDHCVAFLQTVADRDWSAPVPDLDGNVGELVAHIAQAHFWYTIDLWANGTDLVNITPKVSAEADNNTLIVGLSTLASMLASAVRSAPDGARGFHPFGLADASGMAAMGCDETIVHTHDIARAFDVAFEPPPGIAATLLERLFPWVEGDDDPWRLLQWANGRIALEDRPRQEKWLWHCAPLAEWDGTEPIPPPPSI